MLNDGQIHYFSVPFPVMDRFAVRIFQGLYDLFDVLNVLVQI